MTLNTKLRGFSIAFVGLALYLLVNEILAGDRRTGNSWLVVTLCLIIGVIETIRVELRDLRGASNEKNQKENPGQE